MSTMMNIQITNLPNALALRHNFMVESDSNAWVFMRE